MDNFFIGIILIILGLFNTIYFGFMGKTFGSLNVRKINLKVYKWTRIITGIIVTIIGIFMMIRR